MFSFPRVHFYANAVGFTTSNHPEFPLNRGRAGDLHQHTILWCRCTIISEIQAARPAGLGANGKVHFPSPSPHFSAWPTWSISPSVGSTRDAFLNPNQSLQNSCRWKFFIRACCARREKCLVIQAQACAAVHFRPKMELFQGFLMCSALSKLPLEKQDIFLAVIWAGYVTLRKASN